MIVRFILPEYATLGVLEPIDLVGRIAFDSLHQLAIGPDGCQEHVNMVGHDNISVQLIPSSSAKEDCVDYDGCRSGILQMRWAVSFVEETIGERKNHLVVSDPAFFVRFVWSLRFLLQSTAFSENALGHGTRNRPFEHRRDEERISVRNQMRQMSPIRFVHEP